MKLSSGQKLIIFSCVSLVLILAASAGFWWLALNTRTTKQSLHDTRIKLATYTSERQAAGEIKAILEERRPLVDRIQNTIVSHERPIEFLNQITSLGKQTGNKVVLDYAEQESDPENLAFRITAEGTPSSVSTYLKLIELMPYAITIEELRREDISLEKTATRLSIRIRVRATPSP